MFVKLILLYPYSTTTPNLTLTQTLILTRKKQIKYVRINITHSPFTLFDLIFSSEIVTPNFV